MNIEPLELRQMMAATVTLSSSGILRVNGTAENDVIYLRLDRGRVLAQVHSFEPGDDELPTGAVARRFDAKRIKRILIDGGEGNDLATVKLPSFTGKLEFYGGNGDDKASLNVKARAKLVGGDGADTLVGGSAADLILGDDGDDSIEGAGGNDTILGADGMDALYGGPGADSLDGGPGIDLLYGGAHNDTLAGGSGCDGSYGEAGNDLFRAQDGEMDAVLGGAGTDTAYLDVGIGLDILTKTPGAIASFRMMTDVEIVR